MTILLLTLAAFAIAMVAMALGVMVTGRRLQGSCGGAASGTSCVCRREGITPENCPRKRERGQGPAQPTSAKRSLPRFNPTQR